MEQKNKKDEGINQTQVQIFQNDLNKQHITYYDLLQKASHNSFDKGPLVKQLEYDKEYPSFGGCLSIEFDLVQNHNLIGENDNWEFYLQHDGKYKDSSQTMDKALMEILKWSNRNKGHNIITVILDIKKECTFGDANIFCKKIDEVIKRYLPLEKIFTPNDILQNKYENLHEAIKQNGYPQLSNIQNKFLFLMSGSENDSKVHNLRQAYAQQNIRKSLIFLDIDSRHIKPTSLTTIFQNQVQNIQNQQQITQDKNYLNRIFYNQSIKDNNWEQDVILAKQKGYIIRIYKANTEDDWNKCKELGINLIATDKIFSVEWTKFYQKSY